MKNFDIGVGLAIALAWAGATAQSSLVPPGTAYTTLPEPGSGHDYIQGLSETVDPSTGGLTVQLPIPMPSSRGLTLPVSILYSSGGGSPVGPIMYNDISISNEVGGGLAESSDGWKYTLPRAGYTQVSQVMQSSLLESGSNNPLGLVTCYYNVNWTFWDSTGAAKGLGLYTVPWGNPAPNTTPPAYPCLGQDSSVYAPSGYPGGGPPLGEISEVLSSSDYGVQATVNTDEFGGSTPQPLTTLQVADRDGNVYSFNGGSGFGLASSIEDRNGNILSIQDLGNGAFTVTDTTGQVVLRSTPTWSTSTSTLTVRGEASYQLTDETITVGGVPAQALESITLPNGQAYQFTWSTPTQAACSFSVFPPGQLLELQKITYPTGATVTYQWTSAMDRTRSIQVVNVGSPPNIQVVSCPTESVYSRTVSFDGQTPALQQVFSYPEPTWVASDGNYQNLNNLKWTSEQTVVTTTDLIRNTSYTTTYTYVPGGSGEPIQPGLYDVMATQPSMWFSVPVESTVVTANSSNVTVSTEAKNWYNAHYLQAEQDTTAGGKSALTMYSWNGTDQLTEKDEYDFGAPVNTSSSPWTSTAAPLRKTVTNYQPFSATPVFPGSQAIYDRPCQTIVYNSSGTRIAETDNYYDGGSSLCAASAGQATAAVSPAMPSGTYDSTNFASSSTTPRGNVTQTVNWLNTGSSPTTTYAYDQSGQKISETDPCGNGSCSDMSSGSSHTTTYSYKDSPSGSDPYGNSNAYLTTVTYPTVGGVTLQKTFTYNYTIGELTSSKDVNNNQTTTYCYLTNGCSGSTADPFNRLTETDYPDGGKTNVYYQDSTPSVTTTKLQTPNPATTTVAIMDGIGHVIQTQSSDPAGSDVVSTTYDGSGQVFTKTNPFGSTSQPSSTFISTPSGTPATTYYYDALGRMVQQNQPDGSTLQWCYNGVATLFQVANCSSLLGSTTSGNETAGAWVDATDERSIHRQQATSSLGHLLEAMEPNGVSQAPTMETDYAYDMLNNLLSVTQWGGASGTPGGRLRGFQYDGPSRLTSATNPENGIIGYTYDANGNVATKTDARSVQVTYSYDALNRLLSKSYSDSQTPIACYQYDTSSFSCGSGGGNLVGRMTNAWTQKAGTSCNSSGPSTGQYLSLKSMLCYDPMGRPTSAQQQQCIGTTCSSPSPYSISMSYDLAGNQKSLTNSVGEQASGGTQGSPMTLLTYFDGAARPCLTTSSWTGPSPANPTLPPNLFQTNPPSSKTTPGYAPFGGLQNWYLGSNSSTASTACSATPSPTINAQQQFDTRMRLTRFSSTGQVP